jgi:hypothetical protein
MGVFDEGKNGVLFPRRMVMDISSTLRLRIAIVLLCFLGACGTTRAVKPSATESVSAFPASTGVAATGTASASTATAGATATKSPSAPLIAPSRYFNFTGWKLQLPIDQYGGTGGANNIQYPDIEISSSALVAGFVDPYFYADASGHVIFRAPANGAVTSPGVGSDHTRSELREQYSGPGADSNHDWNSAIGGTLTGSVVVHSVATRTDEAIIAQIHGQTSTFITLDYLPAHKDVALSIFTTPADAASTRTPIASGINLNEMITYSLTYVNNSVTIVVNGAKQTFSLDPSWAGTAVYFKLGAYHTAPNTGNAAGDATEVAYSAFSVTH